MATDDELLKRNYRQFIELMPLTLAIAGLSAAEGHRNFTVEQLQARGQVVVNAFKVAKLTAREIIKAG